MPLESQPRGYASVASGGIKLKATYYLTMHGRELDRRVTASLPTG